MIQHSSKHTTHSKDRESPKTLPLRVEAALAVMQMGIDDYATIASTVGLTEAEVERIDHSQDKRIRSLAVHGLAPERRYRLVRPLRCPKCRSRINVAPCLTCCAF